MCYSSVRHLFPTLQTNVLFCNEDNYSKFLSKFCFHFHSSGFSNFKTSGKTNGDIVVSVREIIASKNGSG